MAGKKENLKALFTNTRSRVIIIFTSLLLVIAVVIGLVKFSSSTDVGPLGTSTVTSAPGNIQSIPGALDPTAQYAKLQQIQNVTQAETALKSGGSAIPTIIRTQELGAGVQAVGAPQGEGSVGFSTLAREEEGGPQQSLWLQDLKNSNCSKATVQQVVSQGAAMTDLKRACTCAQLKDNGYQIGDLEPVCSCKELRAAGYNARQLKDAGYSAARLRACGFDACELRNAGFTAQEMKDAGFSDGELKGAGFSDDDIARASGLPEGITEADVRNAGCQVAALQKLRAAGVSASAIRRISGCSAAQLKAAGYTAAELRNAGFSAAELKNAGFTAAELKAAGFSARDLLNAGFTPDDLAKAGFTPAQIMAAESELPPGITPDDVKKAGCDVEALRKERLAGVSAKLIRQYAGCSAKALKEAGFTDNDLANAGFTPAQISAANPLDDNAIRAAGCDPDKLKALFNQGVSAKRIKELNGCSAAALKAAGYDAKSLLDAGFTPQELLAAGFTPQEIKQAAATSDAAIRAAGCDPAKLRQLFEAGVSAKRIRELNGCSAAALKAAGFDAKALSDAGFTPQELLAAGFTPQQLAAAGIDPSAIIAAGRTADCSVASLQAARAAGVSAATIKQTLGCSAAAMKAAGYTAAELRAAGYTAAELKNAGFTAAELKAAGFSAKELRAAGFTAQQLKDAGFSASQLRDAGFSAAELKNAGFTAAQLKAAGYSAKELKDAGFTPEELMKAGFSAKELKEAGFTAAQLRRAGFSNDQLKEAGFTAAELGAGTDTGAQVPGLDGITQPGLPSTMIGLPAGQGRPQTAASVEAANAQQLQAILKKQNEQLADQRYQQQIQQRTSEMLSVANQSLQTWQKIGVQVYTGGEEEDKKDAAQAGLAGFGPNQAGASAIPQATTATGPAPKALIKTGDILFAVLDTSINSDEPGPILATIVSGRFKGAKLIGSFNLPSNSDKMVISFNTMSVPGAAKTTSISAFAIDPNTARTALSSRTNHHYLMRYGSLFASSFLEGFGNAFQSANTTVTIGGTGGGDNITIQNGVGRSALENAVIGLATLGKQWGQVAQQQFNRPTTVEVFSGTGVGILFTQDLTSL
ncbi:type IV secretion protein IcmE [Legionella taurinensis]|uniref:Type IV secretion protein IcmE n=1 Tax=Legionella taurinensis TaxID=70611 RepID=A0A3A5L5H3_9GAMM|nr:type IVB secretion system protein DotG/IcmE [Legionella taurinensis]MDX1837495.1 type IVB secretion system protein DotG/IcmE [Legionella taurinensis]PUT40836.1 type IV secretion protein IcmE [Legionella taurinensis]PUT44257.1 type IV secretion protein IcmE [Legionella taurinensis]PUT47559.1 type IV secretion protein IcmE [Legionella taurinensis]PUT48698.1 type IV secretion protein IcmE [Legionella taurinensis]